MSNVAYYQSILESSFLIFLQKQGASKKTLDNYRTDLKHFTLWAIDTILQAHGAIPPTHYAFLGHISADFLERYKAYLTSRETPSSTTNRRLSTIRMFLCCCLAHGWIQTNPSDDVRNIRTTKKPDAQSGSDNLLSLWSADLVRDGASKSTVKNYTNDVKKFLEWLAQQPT